MQLDLDLHKGPEKPAGPKMHSVSEVTRRIRDLIEKGVGQVWVEGEISNYRKQASGHHYFTLKDAGSQLSCVLFSGAAASLRGLKLAEGLCVQAFGEVSVYEPRGQYQMVIRTLQPKGEGALQAKFEALKRSLAAEGLFDQARKRPLPRFPQRIGLVTSPTGAAIRDFLNVLHRRHPGIEVVINPVRVQGKGAAQEIARAIHEFADVKKHRLPAVDVIVVTRGGGSIEDLWEFNEEVVARALAASPIPTVSAVGHEIDFTIADFVADLRAATPSAAAEILAADCLAVLARLTQDIGRMTRICRHRFDFLTAQLESARQSAVFREPARRLSELIQTLDRHADALHHSAALSTERTTNRLAHLSSRLLARSPANLLQESSLRCRIFAQKLTELTLKDLTAKTARLDRGRGILSALSPQATLERGFTITTDAAGQPLTSVKKVKKGMVLKTRFHDGEAQSVSVNS